MPIEIERKFLVRGDEWRHHVTGVDDIRQAYLYSGARSSARVRIKNNQTATLTVKSKGAELRRLEVEHPLSVFDAEALLALRDSSLIHKLRHAVPYGDHVWEIDVFRGDNAGLIVAEVELRHEDESFQRPSWIGMEVTGRQQYYNSALARTPYSHWSASTRASIATG